MDDKMLGTPEANGDQPSLFGTDREIQPAMLKKIEASMDQLREHQVVDTEPDALWEAVTPDPVSAALEQPLPVAGQPWLRPAHETERFVDTKLLRARWLRVCGGCDAGVGPCTHPIGDPRSVIDQLCEEVDLVRAKLTLEKASKHLAETPTPIRRRLPHKIAFSPVPSIVTRAKKLLGIFHVWELAYGIEYTIHIPAELMKGDVHYDVKFRTEGITYGWFWSRKKARRSVNDVKEYEGSANENSAATLVPVIHNLPPRTPRQRPSLRGIIAQTRADGS